jgi:hypothetical protein
MFKIPARIILRFYGKSEFLRIQPRIKPLMNPCSTFIGAQNSPIILRSYGEAGRGYLARSALGEQHLRCPLVAVRQPSSQLLKS